MILKDIMFEDSINYKKISMILVFPSCTFKCGKEYCQNSSLAQSPNIDVSIPSIITRYLDDPITSAATYRDWETDRKSTRLNSSHSAKSRMPSSA